MENNVNINEATTLILAIVGTIGAVSNYFQNRATVRKLDTEAVVARTKLEDDIRSNVWQQVNEFLDEQKERIANLEAQVATLRNERDVLQGRVAQLEQRERETQAAMALLRVENEKLRSQIRSGSMRRR